MKTKKKLLIAGGGYADIPLILSSKQIGYHVITSGNRQEDLGHKYADETHFEDFSDPDAILSLAKKLNISAICSCCNDFSALSVAYTAEKLGLPGHDNYETAKLIHHKDNYRKFAHENNIPTPYAQGFNTLNAATKGIETFSLPVIIKPVDLTGGKGISIIKSSDEVEGALIKAFQVSRSKRIVIEDYIQGSRHGFSAFLYNKRVVFYFSDNEHYFLNPFMVSAASTPGIIPEEVEKKLCDYSEKIASQLSLVDGIFHIQYILHNGEPIIIEICRRAPGDLYIKFVEHATGIDYPSLIVKAEAGLDCSGLEQKKPNGYYTRHCIMSADPGHVQDIIIDDSIKNNIIDSFLWWKKGNPIHDIMTSKFGIVFLQFNSQDEMMSKTKKLQELIKVKTEYSAG